MRRISLGLVLLLLGCGDNLAGETPPPPTLSQDPIATLTGDGSPCFGSSGVAGDFNADGLIDLAVIDVECFSNELSFIGTQSRVTVFYGATGGTFSGATTMTIEPDVLAIPQEMTLALGDFNGDNVDDLLFDNISGSTFIVEGGPSGLASPQLIELPFGRPTAANIGGDNRDEIIVKSGISSLEVFELTGELAGEVRRIDGIDGERLAVVGDVNGDGLDDFAVVLEGSSYLYTACPASAEACLSSSPAGAPWLDAVVLGSVGDVIGDSQPDVVSFDEWNGLSLHRGTQTTPRAAEWSAYPEPDDRVFNPHRIDVNGDGRGDVVLSSARGVFLFEATTSGVAEQPVFAWPASTHFTQRVRQLGDLNGDGVADFALIEPSFRRSVPGRIRIFAGGEPTGPPPSITIQSDLVCEDTGSSLPDLGVDTGYLGRTVNIRHAEFEADSCEVEHECVTGPGNRKLLDFSVSIQNLGGGAAVVPGPTRAPELWEFDECHGHEHVSGFANYELRSASGAVVLQGHKQGYFLVDVHPYCKVAPAAGIPQEAGGDLSISPGWSDIYTAGIPCQWLDVTEVPDGDYRLHVEVDAGDLIEESDVIPNVGEISISIRGDSVTVN